MLILKCRNLAGSCFMSQVRNKTFSTHSVLGQNRILVNVNYFNGNLGNERNSRNLLNGQLGNSTVGISRKEIGVRYSSTGAIDNVLPILNYLPTELFREFALSIHSFTNLPWWASIVLYTVIIRVTLCFPLSIYQVSFNFCFLKYLFPFLFLKCFFLL